MKIYQGIDEFKKIPKAVVTTGTFDGVHLGHQNILNLVNTIADSNKSETVLITFFPHPRTVLFPDHELKLINTVDENINLLQSHNIDHLIFQKFDIEFSRITALEYIRDILFQKIGLKDLVIGYNHHFGRNREGSIGNLKEYAELYDFKIHEVDAYILNDNSVSSTKIRNAINDGDFELANNYLGYTFHLSGRVIKGNGIGKNLGFPTANLKVNNRNKIIPKNGVYAVNVKYENNNYDGMLNIGKRPTFQKDLFSIEVHLFNFNKIIYDETITIEFVKRIRNEKKFESVEKLKHQLSLDKIASLNILS